MVLETVLPQEPTRRTVTTHMHRARATRQNNFFTACIVRVLVQRHTTAYRLQLLVAAGPPCSSWFKGYEYCILTNRFKQLQAGGSLLLYFKGFTVGLFILVWTCTRTSTSPLINDHACILIESAVPALLLTF